MTDTPIPDPVARWLAGHHQVVLVTLRRDGRPQSSNVAALFDPESATFRISVTDDRAKTRNLRRDPRALVHVLGDDFWSYASVTGVADLGPVTTSPGDAVGRELLEVYQGIRGEPHPDPAEFFADMVSQRRLVLRIRATSYVANQVPTG